MAWNKFLFSVLKYFCKKNKRGKKHSNQENQKPLFTLQQMWEVGIFFPNVQETSLHCDTSTWAFGSWAHALEARHVGRNFREGRGTPSGFGFFYCVATSNHRSKGCKTVDRLFRPAVETSSVGDILRISSGWGNQLGPENIQVPK
jgi:hypothetical protein